MHAFTEVAHYAFVANDVPIDYEHSVQATQIAKELLTQGFWAFTETAPLKAKLRQGDRVVIYLAGHGRRFFLAGAEIEVGCQLANEQELAVLRKLGLGFMSYTIRLTKVHELRPVVPISGMVTSLGFIKDKRNWGLHLRLPVVRISADDFNLITHQPLNPLRFD